jgi:hypothetical protein
MSVLSARVHHADARARGDSTSRSSSTRSRFGPFRALRNESRGATRLQLLRTGNRLQSADQLQPQRTIAHISLSSVVSAFGATRRILAPALLELATRCRSRAAGQATRRASRLSARRCVPSICVPPEYTSSRWRPRSLLSVRRLAVTCQGFESAARTAGRRLEQRAGTGIAMCTRTAREFIVKRPAVRYDRCQVDDVRMYSCCGHVPASGYCGLFLPPGLSSARRRAAETSTHDEMRPPGPPRRYPDSSNAAVGAERLHTGRRRIDTAIQRHRRLAPDRARVASSDGLRVT